MRNPIGGVVEVAAAGRPLPASSVSCGDDCLGGCSGQVERWSEKVDGQVDASVEKFIENMTAEAGGEIVERHDCELGGIKSTLVRVRSAEAREKKPLPFRTGDTVIRKIDRGVFQVSTCGSVPGRNGWLVYLCGDEKPYDASELELLAETRHKNRSTVSVRLTKAAGGELMVSVEDFQKAWASASEVHVKEVNDLHAKIEAMEAKLKATQRKSGRRKKALRQFSATLRDAQWNLQAANQRAATAKHQYESLLTKR